MSLLALPLHAQNAPHLAYALPAGAQQGTTVEVTLGGQYLANAIEAIAPDLLITLGEHGRPMNGQEQTTLRNRFQDLQKTALPSDRAEMIDIRGKLLLWNAQRFTSPTLAETLKVRITVPHDAAPGARELRLRSPQGLSNSVTFLVGTLPEFTETEKIETVPPPTGQPVNQTAIKQPPTDAPVTLPTVINGRIKPRLGNLTQQNRNPQPFTPGDADRYRFTARRGQSLVITAAARALTPYLADAVPGWFQAVLTLYDSHNREVACNDDFRFDPDPVLHYTVPEDGEYSVEIRDAIYRGREDFVYRISIGELPFITSVYPLGARRGAKAKITLAGWNLPKSQLTVSPQSSGVVPVAFSAVNPTFLLVDNLPETTAKPAADSPAKAQRVKLPIVVNGRVESPGRWQVFRIDGHSGQTIVADVEARRLGSPLDSVLRLTDAHDRQIAFNDDYEDKSAGLETHHADSHILATLPATGAYYLYLGDVQRHAGPEYAYRLRISAPLPDFDVRITPSVLNLARNLTTVVTAQAIRRDGFDGAISLALENPPAGLQLSGAVIPAGESEVRFTLVPTAPIRGGQNAAPVALRFQASALISGLPVLHDAVPADDRMQAFFYRHLVPAAELAETVRPNSPFPAPVRLLSDSTVRIPAGDSAHVLVQSPLPPNSPIQNLKFELTDPPEGVTLAQAAPDPAHPGRYDLVIRCDPSKVKPGLRGNLIVTLSGERPPAAAANGRPSVARQRVALDVLPAIPFEIVPLGQPASFSDDLDAPTSKRPRSR